jgi:hypothetical protein
MARLRDYLIAAALVAFTSRLAARAQTAIATDAAVQPATAVTPETSAPRQLVRFRQQPATVGDRVIQRLGVHLGLATKITQSGQTAHESTNEMRRQQQRTIEVLEVKEGRAIKARASFQVSRRQSPENPDPNELATQPIEGKAYLLSRDGEQLKLTDLAGAIPPLEEYKLAAESLENVGKANPLAELLVSRPIVVGQRILIPRETVQTLLGFQEPIGSVRRFELTLNRVEPASDENPTPRAIFQTAIEIIPNEKSPLAIKLNGEMAIETETCRLVAVELSGPVQISSIERTGGGIFNFTAGGELKLAIRSQFDHPQGESKLTK